MHCAYNYMIHTCTYIYTYIQRYMWSHLSTLVSREKLSETETLGTLPDCQEEHLLQLIVCFVRWQVQLVEAGGGEGKMGHDKVGVH